mgnify:CR=1 FL=1
MKRILIVLTLSTLFFTVNGQNKNIQKDQNSSNTAQEATKSANVTIDFESKVIDYGVIEHNSDGARKFVFTNNGTEPLIIKNAKGSCGCTVPTWPREPIAPGETSEIGVKYATNRVGKFTKTITLTTNADKRPVILTVKFLEVSFIAQSTIIKQLVLGINKLQSY